jgi:Cupin superfamily protein
MKAYTFSLALFSLGYSAGNENEFCVAGEDNCHPPPSWNIDDNHPCNIEILSPEEWRVTFPDGFPVFYEKPVILRDPERNRVFQNRTLPEHAPFLFGPNRTVTLPKANLFSFPDTEILVEDFIRAPETNSWDDVESVLYMLMNIDDVSDFIPPPSLATAGDTRLGIGSLGSGAQWHSHGPGFCEIMHGRKHWWLVDSDQHPPYDHTKPSRHWVEYQYSKYMNEDNEKNPLWECTLKAGDAIYFPNRWWHTTVNLDAYVSFVTVFSEIPDES